VFRELDNLAKDTSLKRAVSHGVPTSEHRIASAGCVSLESGASVSARVSIVRVVGESVRGDVSSLARRPGSASPTESVDGVNDERAPQNRVDRREQQHRCGLTCASRGSLPRTASGVTSRSA
jgi:hypothetical protein